MKDRFLYINGLKYNAPQVMEEWISTPPVWKEKGWEFLIQLLDPSDTPIKFISSGTTGVPKEILFTKEQILYSAENTCRYFDINHTSTLLLCLPVDFVAGRMMMARALYAGSPLVWTEPSLNPLKGIEGIQFAAFTPAQVATILADPTTRPIFASIPTIIIGGGEISFPLEKELKTFSNKIFATYGMTETLTHVAVRRIGEPTYQAIYSDIVFSVDEHHCLCIDLPKMSKEKLFTKDVIEWKSEKSFVWKGRYDHVINTGGIKLQAEVLEKKILDTGLLVEGKFYITSQKDAKFGQVPVIVLLKQEEEKPMAELLTSINRMLNKHETVKHIIFIDKFDYTGTGKLIRSKF